MSEDDIRIDQIQRYLMGEMEAQELAEFQQKLQEDHELAADVALEEELQLVVKYQRRRELKTMLQNVEADGSGENTDDEAGPRSSGGMIRPPWKRLIPYVAGMAAIVVAAVFVFRAYNSPVDPQKLAEEYLLASNDPVGSDRGPGDSVAIAGYDEYQREEYDKAFTLLDTTFKDTLSLLLHGISAMKMAPPNFRQAARDFERLEDDVFGDVALEAHWYHALVDLHEMRYDSCLRHLAVFTNDSPVHSVEAEELGKDVARFMQ
jgi:hypothetical protein